jgi:aldehyde:ferredoxin oxidoreductase
MAYGGYADRIAKINLTDGSMKFETIPDDWKRKYIGGRGLGVKYVFENGPQVDPLSPENILCFMNGPLTGSEVNLSGRMAVVTKSPLTNTVTDSHHGGWSAARLRWAGFDGLIFSGRASHPVYALVTEEKVELFDATELWGKGTHETIKLLQAKYGVKDVSIITIGQAGEKLNKFACWMNENDRSSGRGGTGCVGGSKLLKAIVIISTKKMPKALNKELWKASHSRALTELSDTRVVTSPRKGGLSVYGTNVLMNMTNVIGAMPTGNSKTTFFPEHEAISGERIKETILVEDPTCHACPVACKKEVEIKDGPFAGLRMESFEYEPAWAVGANCCNDYAPSVAKMIDQANDYGMDAIEIGNVLSMFMEASEKGYTKGLGTLAWGDYMSMVALVDKVGMREGVGDILAEGTERAARYFGHPEISMTVKGLSMPAYDPRGIKGMGLAYATSNRGACHLRAYTPAAEVIGNVLGPSTITDPLEWKGKGKLVVIFQHVHTVTDCLDMCKFATFAESLDTFADQFSAVTGMEADAGYLLKVGERVYNLERYYNNLCGFREGSDTLPERFLTEPATGPGSTGQICELDLMLEEYYQERGWVNGVVPESKLRELEII